MVNPGHCARSALRRFDEASTNLVEPQWRLQWDVGARENMWCWGMGSRCGDAQVAKPDTEARAISVFAGA